MVFCDYTGMRNELSTRNDNYMRGWGTNRSTQMQIIETRDLCTQEVNGKAFSMYYHVTLENSQIIIGMDIKRFAMTENLARSYFMILNRPAEKSPWMVQTYRSGGYINSRLRLAIPSMITQALIGSNHLHEQATR